MNPRRLRDRNRKLCLVCETGDDCHPYSRACLIWGAGGPNERPLKDPAEEAARFRKWRKENREASNAISIRWQKKNWEKVKAARRRRYQKNKEKELTWAKIYREKNREEINQRRKMKNPKNMEKN